MTLEPPEPSTKATVVVHATRAVELTVEPPADHPWRRRRPPKPILTTLPPNTDDARSPRWFVRAAVTAGVALVIGYGFVTFVERGAHAAPRPQFATNTLPTTAPGAARHALLGVGVALEGASVTVTTVTPASPAARAGIQPGDIVATVDGADVTSPSQLTTIVRDHHPGDTVHLSVVRARQHLIIAVSLAPA